MIEILNISKKFKSHYALSNVSFTVENGEIMGLLGENGAGKSTLLRVLSTMLKPSNGNAIINSYNLIDNSSLIRKNIGILFGNETGLYERLTARENLEFFAQLYGMHKKEINERVNFLVDSFEIKDFQDKLVGTLSRGMKQKVAIARAIVHNPSVILFDEPDSGLDFKAAKIVFDFLSFCKQEEKSVIFSSHSMENIKNFSDRVTVLNKGHVIKIFNTADYREKYSPTELNDILYNLVSDDKIFDESQEESEEGSNDDKSN